MDVGIDLLLIDKKLHVNNNQKTLLGSGITYGHYKKKSGMSNIVMCPGHLVYKWKREIEQLVPNSKAYVVECIEELMDLTDKLKDKYKKEHVYVIISKENAKFSYETRPAAAWSMTKKCFVCPECGQPLHKEEWMGSGKDRYKIRVKLQQEDFLKETAFNVKCDNKIKVFNTKKNKFEEKECGEKLWTPLNKFDNDIAWIKLGSAGWIMKRHFEEIYDKYFNNRDTLNKKEQAFLIKLMEKKDEADSTGELISSRRGVRKYSIAKYVRERLKGYINYFICDELKCVAPYTVMCM